jgi:general L-amino acid transport system permease protein
MADQRQSSSGGGSLFYDPKVRSFVFQVLTVAILVLLAYTIVTNTMENLKARNIAQGFGFLTGTSGFEVVQTPIQYTREDTYARALLVGLLNTLIVAVVGIVMATVIGFLVGVGRLSSNWVVSKLAMVYVELVRNVPLLLQMFFWYFAVLQVLPGPRDSVEMRPLNIVAKPLEWLSWLPVGDTVQTSLAAAAKAIGADAWVIYLNNRGFVGPAIGFNAETGLGLVAVLGGGIVLTLIIRAWARARQAATGKQFPVGRAAFVLIIAAPIAWLVWKNAGISVELPQKTRFNLQGGQRIIPELMALVFALSVYTGAFIAETVRAGILAVAHGQTEAARSLGLQPGRTLQLIIIPQAMRVIIPPLTSQYLNLTKNSSLAVAIGYPDLVYTGGTVLNQTGQAVEVISIWMLVYLGTSIITSLAMNVFNARMAIVER